MITAGRRRGVARITGILAGAAVAGAVVAAPTFTASAQVGASDRPPDFVVEYPSDGQILDDPRPTFRGTTAFGNAMLSDSMAAEWFTASDGDELPDTGSSNLWMMLLGIGLFAAGAAVAARSRRT